MHIGMDGTPLLGRLTGIGWYTYELLSALADAGPQDRFSVLPISWRTAGQVHLPRHAHVELRTRFAPARPLRMSWRSWPVPPLEWLLRCDVFHATNFVSPPAWRTPTVVTVHDLWFRHRPEQVPAVERQLSTLLPTVLRRAAAVITPSQYVARELEQWLPGVGPKLHTIPLAPHHRGSAGGAVALPDGPAFALVLGTVNPRKNIPDSLDALLAARRAGSDCRLVVAGGIDPAVRLDAELGRRGLGPQDVVVLGYVDDAEVTWLLANASVLLSSSLHEGFGLPVLEAMAAGLPVVALAGGAVPEVVGDAGVLVPLDERDRLGAALHGLLGDEVARAELREAGLRRAGGYSWAEVARRTSAVYAAVADGS